MTQPTPTPTELELTTKRDRLIEQFTLLQAELGGAFYEMAIRDHIRLDVLTNQAAVLQRVDAELAETERQLRGEDGPATATCPSCGTPHGAQARFCSTCGYVLQAGGPGSAASSATAGPGTAAGPSAAARGSLHTNGSAAGTHAVPQTGPAAANGRTIT